MPSRGGFRQTDEKFFRMATYDLSVAMNKIIDTAHGVGSAADLYPEDRLERIIEEAKAALLSAGEDPDA